MIETQMIAIDDPQAIPIAQHIIEQGGLIAFPTDTIYGVAADTYNPLAIQKIYDAKQRPDEKALPVLIGEMEQLDKLTLFVSEAARRLADTFWPGALTLILPKGPDIPIDLSPYPTVGVRMPDLAFTLKLLQKTGPLATTSANISGGPNPTTAADVMAQLGGRIDLILDGGPTPGPAASTVVDVSSPDMTILREGPITRSELKALFEED